MMGIHLIFANIIIVCHELLLLRTRDRGMDIDSEDVASYTTQYAKAFLQYVENENCDKHRGVPGNQLEHLPNRIPIPSATPLLSCQSPFDQYNKSNNDEECLIPNIVAESIPGSSDCASRLLNTARQYLNLPPEVPKNGGKLIQISMITTPT